MFLRPIDGDLPAIPRSLGITVHVDIKMTCNYNTNNNVSLYMHTYSMFLW